MDIMISDLPHILYSKKEDGGFDDLTDQQIDDRRTVEHHMNEEIKKHGLKGIAGINIGGFNFKKSNEQNDAKTLGSGALKK